MKPAPCRIRIHEGARLHQGANIYRLLGHAEVDAEPVRNSRGMTTGYHFSYHGATAFVGGHDADWLRDLPRYTVEGRPGLVCVARSLPTGGRVELWYGSEATILSGAKEVPFFDMADGDWITTCETHGTLCNHTTRARAESHLRYADWCEACMRDDDGADTGERWEAGEAEGDDDA